MKRIPWALLGLLALATALRLIALSSRSLWYDEAFAILYAEKSLAAILSGTLSQVGGAAADVHPVAYYFTLHAWMGLFGETPAAVRLLSVCYGVATVAVVYRLARELFGVGPARWSALVVAVAPFQIAYSQETRMYAMLGFWSMAALTAYVWARRSDAPAAWATFVVCGALTLYSHNLGFALFAALGLWVAGRWAWRRDREAGRLFLKTALAGAGMALLFAPWLARVPSQLGKIGQAYWVERPGALTLAQTLLAFGFDFENARMPGWLLPLALFGAMLALALIVWRLARRRDGAAGWLALLAFLPILLVFLISQWRPVYIIRGLLPASILYAALVGWALADLPKPARWVFGLPLAGIVVAALFAYYGYDGFPRGPYAALDAALREAAGPHDVIVHSNKLTFFPAHVYDRGLPQVFLGDPAGSGSDTLALPTQEALGLFATELEPATAGKARVWLVIFQPALDEMGGTHPHVAWLKARYRLAESRPFGDMRLLRFE
jgi:4-amino-4-deoxy-L-arabinose transferase-like glycosyltransferase